MRGARRRGRDLLGNGGVGQLGQGGFVNNIGAGDVPADHPPLFYDGVRTATQVSASWISTCALLDDNTVWCWGNGLMVSTGVPPTPIGNDEHASVNPPKVFGAPVVEISNAGSFACVRTMANAVRCWGIGYPAGNSQGGLGYGHTLDELIPGAVGDLSLGDTVQELSHGRAHGCALTDGGDALCWGANYNGELGHGDLAPVGDNELPSAAGPASIGGTARAVCAGTNHSCAVLDDGTIRCFGDNTLGQLGYGHLNDIGDDETPDTQPAIDFSPREAVSIACGSAMTCALLDDGGVRCWGSNSNGQLGLGHTDPVSDPTPSEDTQVL